MTMSKKRRYVALTTLRILETGELVRPGQECELSAKTAQAALALGLVKQKQEQEEDHGESDRV